MLLHATSRWFEALKAAGADESEAKDAPSVPEAREAEAPAESLWSCLRSSDKQLGQVQGAAVQAEGPPEAAVEPAATTAPAAAEGGWQKHIAIRHLSLVHGVELQNSSRR